MNTYEVQWIGYDNETAEVKADSFTVNDNGVTFYAGGFPSPVAYFKSVRSVELVEDAPATEAAPSDDLALANAAYNLAYQAWVDAKEAKEAAWERWNALSVLANA